MLREVTIRPALNGYIATVGCQTVVFNDRATMLNELDSYLADPVATEKRYREEAVNKSMLTVLTAASTGPTGPGNGNLIFAGGAGQVHRDAAL